MIDTLVQVCIALFTGYGAFSLWLRDHNLLTLDATVGYRDQIAGRDTFGDGVIDAAKPQTLTVGAVVANQTAGPVTVTAIELSGLPLTARPGSAAITRGKVLVLPVHQPIGIGKDHSFAFEVDVGWSSVPPDGPARLSIRAAINRNWSVTWNSHRNARSIIPVEIIRKNAPKVLVANRSESI